MEEPSTLEEPRELEDTLKAPITSCAQFYLENDILKNTNDLVNHPSVLDDDKKKKVLELK